jgi:hypothetical protein
MLSRDGINSSLLMPRNIIFACCSVTKVYIGFLAGVLIQNLKIISMVLTFFMIVAFKVAEIVNH